MIKPSVVLALGVLVVACSSVSATNIGEAHKRQCKAIPELDNATEIEVVQACKAWMETEPGSGDPHYYYGRTMVEAGNFDRAKELFVAGTEKGSQLAEDALWFSREGSLYGGLAPLSEPALEYFQGQADAGNPVGEVLIAIQVGHYSEGVDKRESRRRRMSLLKSASDTGEPIATYLLGAMLVYDDDPGNDGEGIRLLRVAAEEGVGVAYEDLRDLEEISEVPVEMLKTRYRSAAPVDLVMRRP